LSRNGISATYYHAGLTFEQREQHQEDWIKNKRRVMVATNAFGMGIDKPDVRTVVHLDLPENLESYYQEAGRAGRDGKPSYAVIVYHDSDVTSLENKVRLSHPSIKSMQVVYQALANFFQVALGSSEGESFNFELHDFCDRFKLNISETYNALKKLEEEGLIEFNESFYSPSVLHISVDNARLYEFQVANARFDPLIKMLLRLYGGSLFTEFTKISEAYLANALKISVRELSELLTHLSNLQIVVYQPVKSKPQLTFVLPRQDAEKLPLDIKRLEERKALAEFKMNAIVNFVTSTHRCRMLIVQEYFGEETDATCGKCDVCIAKKKRENLTELKALRSEILTILKLGDYTIDELEIKITPPDQELFVDVIREMVDDGELEYDSVWRLKMKAPNNK
jgi:ATP-dependent DNA helicase RecQ